MILDRKVLSRKVFTAFLCCAVGILYILYGGLSIASNVIGYFYIYFAFVLILDILKDIPIIKTIWKVSLLPLNAIYKLVQLQTSRRVITVTLVCVFYVLFLLLVILLTNFFPNLDSRWFMVILYVALVIGSFVITTSGFEKLFNKIRIEPMAEYSALLGKFIIHLLYLILLVCGTIGYLLTDSKTPLITFLMPKVILPAFVTFLALERVLSSKKLMKDYLQTGT